jgi:hypothetical protein
VLVQLLIELVHRQQEPPEFLERDNAFDKQMDYFQNAAPHGQRLDFGQKLLIRQLVCFDRLWKGLDRRNVALEQILNGVEYYIIMTILLGSFDQLVTVSLVRYTSFLV